MGHVGLGIFLNDKMVSLAAVRSGYRQTEIVGTTTVILNKSETNQQMVEEIAGIIRGFCRDNNLKPRYVSVALGQKDFIWSLVECPPVSRNDLNQLMQYELELHVPSNPDSVNFDVIPLENVEYVNSKALLITSSRTIIDNIIEIMQRTGLRLNRIEPAPMARWTYWAEHFKNTAELRNRLYINFNQGIADYQIEIMLLSQGMPISYRVISGADPWGRNQKNQQPSMKDQDWPVQNLLNELHLTILSLGLTEIPEQLTEVVVLGEFPELWRQKLEESESVFTFKSINEFVSGNSRPIGIEEITSSGAALGTIEAENAINLLPVSLRPIQRHASIMVIGILAGILASLAIMGMASDYWETDIELLQTKARIAAIESSVNTIIDVNREYDSVKKQYEFFRTMKQEYPSQLEILRELTNILPAEDSDEKDEESGEVESKVFLEEYNIKGDQLSIRGKSDSPEGLINVLEESPFFEKVQLDGTVSGKNFRIKAQLTKRQPIEEEPVLDETGEEKTDIPSTGQATPTPESIVNTPPESEEEQHEEESGDQEYRRGPAYPSGEGNKNHQEDEPSETDSEMQMDVEHFGDHASDSIGDGDNFESNSTPEPTDPVDGNHEKMDELPTEDLDAMKANLFDFIQKSKDEGTVIERDPETFEAQDSEEAAANFLDFLKSVSTDDDTETVNEE